MIMKYSNNNYRSKFLYNLVIGPFWNYKIISTFDKLELTYIKLKINIIIC